MAGKAVAIDASGGAPAYAAVDWRQAQAALLSNGTADAFGARGGRRPGAGCVVTMTSTTAWQMTAGAFVAYPRFSATQGPYLVTFSANETGTITTPNATNPRIDLLVVTIDDAGASDGSGARQGRVQYVVGTAASSPVAPAVPARSTLLATLNVPVSGGGTATVTMGPMAVAAGGILPVRTASERTAIAAPHDGLAVADGDTGRLWLRALAAWALIPSGFDVQYGEMIVTTTITGGNGPFTYARPFASKPALFIESGDLGAFVGVFAQYEPGCTSTQFTFNAYRLTGGGATTNSGDVMRIQFLAIGPAA